MSLGASENIGDILERMAAIEGKMEKLQEKCVQKEQRIRNLEATNIGLKTELENLKVSICLIMQIAEASNDSSCSNRLILKIKLSFNFK